MNAIKCQSSDIVQAHRSYEYDIELYKKFELASGNIRKTWLLINELRGEKKADIKASFIIDGQIVTERRDIANGFNLFFSSIARKLNSKVQMSRPVSNANDEKNADEKFTKYYKLKKRMINSIYLSPCDEKEIIEIIQDLENGKASDISISLLKKCREMLSPYLSSVKIFQLVSGKWGIPTNSQIRCYNSNFQERGHQIS